MSDERERITVSDYRNQNLLLLRQMTENTGELAKDMKDVRERVVKLESENVSGQISGLRADIRANEERTRRLVEGYDDRFSKVETRVTKAEGGLKGVQDLVRWVGGIAAIVTAALIVYVLAFVGLGK